MILKAVLIIALCCAIAAWLVTWAKLEDERRERKDADEAVAWHVKRMEEMKWDHISEMTTLEKEEEGLRDYVDAEIEFADDLIDKNRALQDKLSAVLCPTNNHVWKDGVCVKCGRVKDA